MGLMLDSSALIESERGRLDLPARLERYGDEPVVIAAITASELLHGVHRARDEEQRRARGAFVEAVLPELPIVEFGLEEARLHAALGADLECRGQRILAHDLLIAASALGLGFRVATCDARHFTRVPGLDVEFWGE